MQKKHIYLYAYSLKEFKNYIYLVFVELNKKFRFNVLDKLRNKKMIF